MRPKHKSTINLVIFNIWFMHILYKSDIIVSFAHKVVKKQRIAMIYQKVSFLILLTGI